MRERTIREQRDEHGRKAVAVLPVHYPKALLTAMDVLAVELWGPPGPPRGIDAGRLQPYVCAIARNALAFLASGGADAVDAVLFPHTCDSIQGLATLAPDFGGWSKPVLRFQHPKGEPQASTAAFVRGELESLARALAELTGHALEIPRLHAAIALHRRIDTLRLQLLSARRRVPLGDRDLYALLRRGEWLWPDDHLAELERAAADLASGDVQRGVPVMVSGYVPVPAAFFDVLTEAGAVVVADDYAAIGRRLPRTSALSSELSPDPMTALGELARALPPCPTRGDAQARRLEHLEQLFVQSGSRGLVLHVMKFCEPELFDLPAIRARFAARGVPLLVLEGELERDLSGQAQTRIEAFIESVAARGAA